MTVSPQPLTLEDFLTQPTPTEAVYEFVDGALIEMPPESDLNNLIAMVLIGALMQVVPIQRLRRGTEIVVMGARATVRVPDLMVLSPELMEALAGATRSTITSDMPPPLLVVEVVSPGKEKEDRDYRYKRSEYAARGIAEYWIVDPAKAQVMVLTLVDGLYEEAIFQGTSALVSPLFPQLNLTVAQILHTGQP